MKNLTATDSFKVFFRAIADVISGFADIFKRPKKKTEEKKPKDIESEITKMEKKELVDNKNKTSAIDLDQYRKKQIINKIKHNQEKQRRKFS